MASSGFFRGHIEWHVAEFHRNPAEHLRYLEHAYRWNTGYPVFIMFNRVGGAAMARGNGNKSAGSQPTQGQWTQFVNISMAGVTPDDIARHFGSADALANGVSHLLGSNYRIGLSYDPERDVVIVSVTGRDVDSPNSGKTFTSFAQTWPEALRVALFKHYVVTAEVWPAPLPRRDGALFG